MGSAGTSSGHRRSEALELDVRCFKPSKCLLFHLQVGFDLAVRRARALVAEPQCDHVERHAALQKIHGCRVSPGYAGIRAWPSGSVVLRWPCPPPAPVAAPRCCGSSDARIDWATMLPNHAVAGWRVAKRGGFSGRSVSCGECPALPRKRSTYLSNCGLDIMSV